MIVLPYAIMSQISTIVSLHQQMTDEIPAGVNQMNMPGV